MCHSCVSSSPEFPPLPSWEGPASPKGPPGEGAAVSFLRKQESRKKQLDSRFRGNDIQGGRWKWIPSACKWAHQTSALRKSPLIRL